METEFSTKLEDIKDDDSVEVEYESMAVRLILDEELLTVGKHTQKLLGKNVKHAAKMVENEECLKQYDIYCNQYLGKVKEIEKTAKDEVDRKSNMKILHGQKQAPQAKFFLQYERDVRPLRSLKILKNYGPPKTLMNEVQKKENLLLETLFEMVKNSKEEKEALLTKLTELSTDKKKEK